MLLGGLMTAVLVAKLFPDTPSGAWLHRLLIEAPARRLAELRLRHLILASVVVGLVLAFGPVIGPADMLLVAAGDLSVYVEALAALGAAAALLRSRAVWRALKTGAAPQLARARAMLRPTRPHGAPRRIRPGRRARPPATDDPAPAWSGPAILA